MQNYIYFAKTQSNGDGGFIITFPDVKGAIAEGATMEQAQADATIVLALMLEHLIQAQKPMPKPNFTSNLLIRLPALVILKLELNKIFVKSTYTQTSYAQATGKKQQEISRMLDVTHNTKLESIEKMLLHLGKHLDIIITPNKTAA